MLEISDLKKHPLYINKIIGGELNQNIFNILKISPTKIH